MAEISIEIETMGKRQGDHVTFGIKFWRSLNRSIFKGLLGIEFSFEFNDLHDIPYFYVIIIL